MSLIINAAPIPNKDFNLYYTGEDALIKEYTRLLEYDETLEELANWYLKHSIRPQPGIILSAIISTCSILMGRGIELFGKKANVFTLVISGTSTGKNAIFSLSKTLIKCCDCDHTIGADAIVSGEGLMNELRAKPEIFWPLDEIQDTIKGIGGPKAQSYSINVAKYLKTMFGGTSDFRERVLGGDKNVNKAPMGEVYPVILAAAQPLSFWSNVSKGMIADGFIPRFLAFTGDDEILIDSQQLVSAHINGSATTAKPPPIIIDRIKMWTRRRIDTSLMELANVPGMVPTIKCGGDEVVLGYLGQRLTDFDYAIRSLCKENQELAELHGKNTEYLVKLSLISAWIRSPAIPVLTVRDIDWATRIIQCSNTLLRDGYTNHNVLSDFHKNSLVILNYLEENPDGANKATINSLLRGLPSYHVEQVITKLTDTGDIYRYQVTNLDNPNRLDTVYAHAKHKKRKNKQGIA